MSKDLQMIKALNATITLIFTRKVFLQESQIAESSGKTGTMTTYPW